MAKKLNNKKTTQAILKNVSDGLNDFQIYSALKVASSTFNVWKKEHEQEYNEAKEVANVNG
ncbi:MAG: bacteriophage terminase small subunit [Leuconostoc mesenteroides]